MTAGHWHRPAPGGQHLDAGQRALRHGTGDGPASRVGRGTGQDACEASIAQFQVKDDRFHDSTPLYAQGQALLVDMGYHGGGGLGRILFYQDPSTQKVLDSTGQDTRHQRASSHRWGWPDVG